MEYGASIIIRKQLIEDATKTEVTYRTKFKDRELILPELLIPIDIVKYRLGNMRTESAQRDYLIKNNKDKDFFTKDMESIEAQQAQHNILKTMLGSGSKNLISYFSKKENTQTEPIVLDQNGYVISGNRRTCTFRELYYEDPSKYSHFGNISCYVLPTTNEDDIDAFEAREDVQENVKQEYDWISKGFGLRKRIQSGKNINEICALYQMKETFIKSLLEQLQVAEDISEERNVTFDEIVFRENVIKEYLNSRKKYSRKWSPQKRKFFREIVFNFITDNGNSVISGRLNEKIKPFAESLDDCIDSLTEEFDHNDVNELIDNISNDCTDERYFSIISDRIDSKKTKKMQSQTRGMVYDNIKKAEKNIDTAKISLDSRSIKLEDSISQIDLIVKKLSELKDSIKNITNSN